MRSSAPRPAGSSLEMQTVSVGDQGESSADTAASSGRSGSSLRREVFSVHDVYVHPSSLNEDQIGGRIGLMQEDDGMHLHWTPYTFEGRDYMFVTSPESPTGVGTVRQPGEFSTATADPAQYALNIPLSELHSVRRRVPTIGWSHLVFVLRDGVTIPPLYFHGGSIGARELFMHIGQYIPLAKSPDDSGLHIVADGATDLLQRSLNELDLLPIISAVKDGSWNLLESFSKVTKLARESQAAVLHYFDPSRGPLGPSTSYPASRSFDHSAAAETVRPAASYVSARDNALDCRQQTHTDLGTFEILSQDSVSTPLPEVTRAAPVSRAVFEGFFNPDGAMNDEAAFRRAVFVGGIDPSVRVDAWKFLLGYYSSAHTKEQRIKHRDQKEAEYYKLKTQWQSISPAQEQRFAKFRDRRHRIEKDVVRTDRTHPFFDGNDNPNLRRLFEILLTYSFYDFDLGYVQGMSDLLAPILVVMDDDVDAFWCFSSVMDVMHNNFERDQNGMHTHLKRLADLLKVASPQLFRYFEEHDSSNLYFCFRWLLIMFKREFPFGDVMRLWEVCWSNHLSRHFHLFVCLAILEDHRGVIVGAEMGFDDILKYVNDLAYTLDVERVMSRAEAHFYRTAALKAPPEEIAELLVPFRKQRPQSQ